MGKKQTQPQVPPSPPPGAAPSTAAPTVPLATNFLDASVVFGQTLNIKQEKKRQSKAKQSSLKMRKHLWPEIQDSALWLREDETRKGFTTIPRTMPLFINLIQDTSKHVANGKSVPAGKSYLVLWCRVFDEGFLKIDQEAAAARGGFGS